MCCDHWLFQNFHWLSYITDSSYSDLVKLKTPQHCKILIGITPQRSIAFISQGWGGRTSDVHLSENSGLLQKLLYTRWYSVSRERIHHSRDSRPVLCWSKTTPFTWGKRQLSKIEVDAAYRLSRVRIHVERVIGLIQQKYKILESRLSQHYLLIC